MTRRCPDCGFVQPGSRDHCKACGSSLDADRSRRPGEARQSRRRTSVARGLLTVPDNTTLQHLIGYALLTAGLIYVGASYVITPIVRSQTPPTAVHRILELADLVFHEAGHVFFMFFGDTLHSLGGSIMQLLIPTVCLVAFVSRYRDPVGAAVSLWWIGQNLISMAPYINDARPQRLVLLGGVTGRDAPGYHDWNTVLTNLDLLEWDGSLAMAAHGIGSLLIIASSLWAGMLVLQAFFAWQAPAASPRRR